MLVNTQQNLFTYCFLRHRGSKESYVESKNQFFLLCLIADWLGVSFVNRVIGEFDIWGAMFSCLAGLRVCIFEEIFITIYFSIPEPNKR